MIQTWINKSFNLCIDVFSRFFSFNIQFIFYLFVPFLVILGTLYLINLLRR